MVKSTNMPDRPPKGNVPVVDDGKLRRVASGVTGFDDLIEGGIPDRSLVLLVGPTGTGKSLFAMNFLIHGAMNGENGVYISLQEKLDETIGEMRFFWPEIDKLVKEKKVLIAQPELYNFDSLLATLEDSIDEVGAKRLVLDSISIIEMYFDEPFRIRKSLIAMANLMKKLGCTTIAISQMSQGMPLYGVEEFVADGVVQTHYIRSDPVFVRGLSVKKMRLTKHTMAIHPIEIKAPGGVVVFPDKAIRSERHQ